MSDPLHDALGESEVSLGRQVRMATMWAGAGSVGMKVTSFLLTIVMARILSPHEFGVFAIALTIHTVVASLGELGAGAYLIRHGRSVDDAAPTVATISVVTSGVLALMMYATAGPVTRAFGVPEAEAPVRILSICVVMVGLWAVPGAVLTRDFRQDKELIATLAGLVPGNLVMLIGALHGMGADAFAWGRVIGTFVTGLFLTYWSPWRFGFKREYVVPILKFGLPLSASGMVTLALLNTDFAIVGHHEGAVALGIYSLAFNISSWAVTLVNGPVAAVTMPAFARVAHDDAAFRTMFVRVFRLLGGMAFLISFTVAALSEPLISTVYGHRWDAAIPVLRVLPAFAALNMLATLTSNLLVGRGHPRLPLMIQTLWLLTLAPAMWVAVDHWAAIGAAFAHVLVIIVVVSPCYLYTLLRWTPVTPRLVVEALGRPFAASVLAAGVAFLASILLPGPAPARLLVGGTLSVAVFSALMWPLIRPFAEPVVARLCAGSLGRSRSGTN